MTMPLPTDRRIELLAAEAADLEPWLGPFNAADLSAWLADQLGDARALDTWIARGGIHSRAVALDPVLHIISGNTPHAGFQSLFRGLLLGGRQRVKLPSAGLSVLEAWISGLPAELAALVETSRILPDSWRDSPATVVFGGDETITFFRDWCGPETKLLEHGPKISAAMLFAEPDVEILGALAADILREDQRGCLSVQNILCDASVINVRAFAQNLASSLESARESFPCPQRELSDSGRIRNFRESHRYRAANGAPIALFESAGSTSWTVVLDATSGGPLLTSTPGGGTVIIRPIDGHPSASSPRSLTIGNLGPEAAFLSTIVAHPFDDPEIISRLDLLGAPRICAPGMAQFPRLFWSHDGTRPLAELVRWRDLG